MADRKPIHGKPGTKSKGATERRLSKNDLDRMIEEAVVDAYGESEQITAFFTMLEDNLELPFDAVVLGVDVKVEKLDLTDDEQIVFVCRRGRERLTLDILELPLPEPPPNGWGWVEAYRPIQPLACKGNLSAVRFRPPAC